MPETVTPQALSDWLNPKNYLDWVNKILAKIGPGVVPDWVAVIAGPIINHLLGRLGKIFTGDAARRDAAFKAVDEMAAATAADLDPVRPGTAKMGFVSYEPGSVTVQASQEQEGFLVGIGAFLVPYDQDVKIRYTLVPRDGWTNQAGIRAAIVCKRNNEANIVWSNQAQQDCGWRPLPRCDSVPKSGEQTLRLSAGPYAILIVGSHGTCEGEVTVQYEKISETAARLPFNLASLAMYAAAAGGGIAVASALARTRRA